MKFISTKTAGMRRSSGFLFVGSKDSAFRSIGRHWHELMGSLWDISLYMILPYLRELTYWNWRQESSSALWYIWIWPIRCWEIISWNFLFIEKCRRLIGLFASHTINSMECRTFEYLLKITDIQNQKKVKIKCWGWEEDTRCRIWMFNWNQWSL